MPGSRRRRRWSANLKVTRAPCTTHLENDEDDEDDDFMPLIPRRSISNAGEGSMITVRGCSRITSRWCTTDKEIGRTTIVIAQDDDDDDDFMPQQQR